MARTEILARRSYTRKVFDLGGGQFASQFHLGHIHYRDDLAGELTDVDLTFEDMGTFWRVSKASYRLRVAKDFSAPWLIEFTNRYEGANHAIRYDPKRLAWMRNRDLAAAVTIGTAQPVTGVLSADGTTIRYTDAFGPGLHFEVQLRRHGFTKEIVIESQAALGTPPHSQSVVALGSRYEGTGLTVRTPDGQTWDGVSDFEPSGRVEVAEVGGQASIVHPAYARDAARQRAWVPVAWLSRAGALWQVKVLPRAVVNGATYPLRADTVTQFFSGGGDGTVEADSTNLSTWDTLHDLSTGDDAYVTDASVEVYVGRFVGRLFIGRGFFPVDTSGIPDGDSITGAIFSVQLVVGGDDDNDGNDFFVVVGPTSQASSTTLVTGDFDQCGAIDNPQELSDRVDIGSLSSPGRNSWTLNATGLAAISKTGVTLLGMREGHDVLDDPPNFSANNQTNRIAVSTSESSGTTDDPYLEVTHAAAGGLSIPIFRSSIFRSPIFRGA